MPVGTEIMAEAKSCEVDPRILDLYDAEVGVTSSSAHRTK